MKYRLFEKMNYKKIYDGLINRARERSKLEGYTEKHHIIPRSAGGDDSKDNLVTLTAREHYIAHKLLYKIDPTPSNTFALVALARMSWNGVSKCGSRQLEEARRLSAELSRKRMTENNPGKGLFGEDSLKFIGYWVTPYGVFGSVYEAEKEIGISKSAIQRRCRDCDRVVKAPRLGKSRIGKTWREQGWYFIKKEES